jgi:hypothetical protein
LKFAAWTEKKKLTKIVESLLKPSQLVIITIIVREFLLCYSFFKMKTTTKTNEEEKKKREQIKLTATVE